MDAPRERIFELWTDPGAVKRWFGGQDVEVETVDIDLRVGGRYAIRIREEEGHTLITGEFLNVEIPERLVYTWKMEGPELQAGENVVRVAFRDQEGRTEVVLSHGPFVDPQVEGAHRQGWVVCLDALEGLL